MKRVPSILALFALIILVSAYSADAREKPNVLFIAIDDLNDWVGGDVDLSAITEIYIEKFGATELETFKVKEIAIGK